MKLSMCRVSLQTARWVIVRILMMTVSQVDAQSYYRENPNNTERPHPQFEALKYSADSIPTAIFLAASDTVEFRKLKEAVETCDDIHQASAFVYILLLDMQNPRASYLNGIEYILSAYKLSASRLFIIDSKDVSKDFLIDLIADGFQEQPLILPIARGVDICQTVRKNLAK